MKQQFLYPVFAKKGNETTLIANFPSKEEARSFMSKEQQRRDSFDVVFFVREVHNEQ